jgi:hypothetical protein
MQAAGWQVGQATGRIAVARVVLSLLSAAAVVVVAAVVAAQYSRLAQGLQQVLLLPQAGQAMDRAAAALRSGQHQMG